MSERRTVYFRVDPAMQAYCEWLEGDSSRSFDLNAYDLFAAGYRARVDEMAAPALPPAAMEMTRAGAVELPGLDGDS